MILLPINGYTIFLFSYFIGLLNKEAWTYWNKNKTKYWFTTWSEYEENNTLKLAKIQKKHGNYTVRRLERTSYFYHIAASFGTAFLSSFIIIFIKFLSNCLDNSKLDYELGQILILLFVIILFCIWYNKKKMDQYNLTVGILYNSR